MAGTQGKPGGKKSAPVSQTLKSTASGNTVSNSSTFRGTDPKPIRGRSGTPR